MMDSDLMNQLTLNLWIANSEEDLLVGLEEWLELDLLTEAHLLTLCRTSLSCPITLSLTPSEAHPNLLRGLEVWARQGRLSDEQILAWSREHLSLNLPEATEGTTLPESPIWLAEPSPASGRKSRRRRSVATGSESVAPSQGGVSQILQSLMDEISVLWLLFLGVFLVVVSSAILAASQWDQVPPAGQYGILWGYTFALWAVSHWMGRRASLTLTSQTLQLTALLIIPVNFWMIDSFQLIQGGLSLGVAIAAGVILSGLMALTLNPQRRDRWIDAGERPQRGWLTFLNLLLLAWLHWGWSVKGFGAIAIYVGIIATGFCTLSLPASMQTQPRAPTRYQFVDVLALTPLYAVLLLLLRGIWIAQLPLTQLSLAFGLVGWIACRISQTPRLGASLWWFAGVAFLLVGRWIAEVQATDLSALLITLLGMWVLGDRLKRTWHPWILWAMVLTGLQGLWPLYGLFPDAVRTAILDPLRAAAGDRGFLNAVRSLLGLPYEWLLLWGTNRLKGHPTLSRLLEHITLGLGALLTLLCLENPLLRTVYLTLVFITLVLRLRHRTNASEPMLFLVHGVALGAIASGLNWLAPTLSLSGWAFVFLGGMLLEWGTALGRSQSRWQRSCWWAGLLMATLAYGCFFFLGSAQPRFGVWLSFSPEKGTAWLIPLALVGLGMVRSFPQAALARPLGVLALFAIQGLCLDSMLFRTLGFVLGTGLIMTSARSMRQGLIVGIAVGWALACEANLFLSYVPSAFLEWFWVLVPASSLVLMGLRQTLPARSSEHPTLTQPSPLSELYRRALYAWSWGCDSAMMLVIWGLALVCFTLPSVISLPSLAWQMGAGGTILSTLYRAWRCPSAVALYAIAVALQGWIGLLAPLTDRPYDMLAVGTLLSGLGFAGLLFSPVQHRIEPRHWEPLPLSLAGLGCLIGHHDFLNSTGFYTLAAGVLVLLVGRRRLGLRVAIYIGIAALSLGIYELFVYDLLQQGGEHPGDALVLLAGLAAGVALGDRFLTRWSDWLLRLPRRQFLNVAHVHWLIAGVFLITALGMPMRIWAEVAWIGLMLVLSLYAVFAGRQQILFLYAGIGQGLAAIAFGVVQLLSELAVGRWGVAIAVGVSAILYFLPWRRWGWDRSPGQYMAMILPISIVLITLPLVSLSSVLLAGAWYFWVGQRPNLLRLSYLGIVLADWALLRLVDRSFGISLMWLAAILGSSILLVIQLEPMLQTPEKREIRHWLRCLALMLVSGTALYESDGYLGWSLMTVLGGLLLGGAGLVLQIRAFLYVGTGLFIVKVLWLLWAFVADHSLLLWALGIVLGILLIWIAATFESRRSQAIAFLEYWVDALQRWQ